MNFQCSVADHCSSLEKNIALVQERAKNEADMDDIWADVEETDDRNVNEIFKFQKKQHLNNEKNVFIGKIDESCQFTGK